MLTAALTGLLTGLGLIVAIGAQNAFVLRQGIARRHTALVVAICAVSDIVLIVAGVAGLATALQRAPWVVQAMRWGGVVFLTWYGLRSLWRARRATPLTQSAATTVSARGAAATALALTWLNPHVYLDTVLLLGAVANAGPHEQRWWFAAGAATASVAWFTLLGTGAWALRGVLASARTWRVLDVVFGVGMLVIAGGLARG